MSEENTITFNEFKSFITGLIRGKKGVLPDVDDWAEIKKMMDKVVPEVEIREVERAEKPTWPQPQNPFQPHNPYQDNTWPTYPSYPSVPETPVWDPNKIFYSGDTTTSYSIGMDFSKFDSVTINSLINSITTKSTTKVITVEDIDSDVFLDTGFSEDPYFKVTGYAKK